MDGAWTDHIVVLALGGIGAISLFVLTVSRPAFGAYAYLAASPLIVGFARGNVIAALRPNEVLLLVIIAGLATRTLISMLARNYKDPPFTIIDVALVILATASSIFPIGQRLARSLPVSMDDLLYSVVLWKYFILFRCFRAAIVTPSQALRCVWISMASASVSAMVGVLQVTNLLGVPEFLHSYFDQPFEGDTSVITDRATSTLGSSFGFADVMIINLVLSLALIDKRQQPIWLIMPAAILFLCGTVASGEFSAFIGLGIALAAFGFVSGRARVVVGTAVPSVLIACVVSWSVIAKRLADFDQSSSGLPGSWMRRWSNLESFFFPQLFSGLNWVWGVRPAPRIAAPEHWREWVYIESGYVWLVWIGGLPFLAAFAFFAWVSGRHLWRVARLRNDAVGASATAGFTYLVVLLVLMVLDPHLTLRGSADLFFPVLAISFAGSAIEGRTRDARISSLRLRPRTAQDGFARGMASDAPHHRFPSRLQASQLHSTQPGSPPKWLPHA
jgi:hypothetical protein